MQAKGFLFGLGIGFILTASINYVIYNSETNNNNIAAEINDDDIRQRAKELGMVEISALPSKSQEIASEATSIDIERESKGNDELTTQQAQQVIVSNNNETAKNNELKVKESNGESVTVIIPSGTSATAFGNILQQEGIIEDGYDFTRYLIENKNTKRIKTGTVELKKNSTYEEICNVIIE